ncbi:MAG: hypothetical protein ACFB50_17625 [Rubrobacteraceae bacterium]
MQSAREEVRDLERVRYVTENYERLQGLRNVPLGLIAFVTGASMLLPSSSTYFGYVVGEVFFYALILMLIATVLLYFVAGNYYERRFGWVQTFSMKRKQVVAVATAIGVLLGVGSVNLVFQPPIHMIWVVWGLSAAAIYWPERRFRMHYVAIGVLVVGASFLPLFGITSVSLAYETGGLLAFLGVFYLVGGILDHLLLVRTMKHLPEDDGRAV